MAVSALPFLLLLVSGSTVIRAEKPADPPSLTQPIPLSQERQEAKEQKTLIREVLQGQFGEEQLAGFGDQPLPLKDLVGRMSPEQKAGARARLQELELGAVTPAQREQIAEGYMLLGNFEGAAKVAARLRREEPDNPRAYHLAAGAQYQLGNLPAAAEAAKAALELNPNDQAARDMWLLTKDRADSHSVSIPSDPFGRGATPPLGGNSLVNGSGATNENLPSLITKSLVANLPTPPAPVDVEPLPKDASIDKIAKVAFTAAATSTGGLLLFLGLGARKLEEEFPNIRRNVGIAIGVTGAVAVGARSLPVLAPLLSNPSVIERTRAAVVAADTAQGQRQRLGVNVAQRLGSQTGVVQTLSSAPGQVSQELQSVLAAGERIRNLLMPGGRPIGDKGSSANIRIMRGTIQDAERFFAELTKDAQVLAHPRGGSIGKMVKFADGTTIGFRRTSHSGPPTIDINIPGFRAVRKIKFVSP